MKTFLEFVTLVEMQPVAEDHSLKPTNRASERIREKPNYYSSTHQDPDLDSRYKYTPKHMKRDQDILKSRKPYDRVTSSDETKAIKKRRAGMTEEEIVEFLSKLFGSKKKPATTPFTKPKNAVGHGDKAYRTNHSYGAGSDIDPQTVPEFKPTWQNAGR